MNKLTWKHVLGILALSVVFYFSALGVVLTLMFPVEDRAGLGVFDLYAAYFRGIAFKWGLFR